MRKQRTANPMWWRGSGGDFHVDPLSKITVRDVLEVFDEMIDVQRDSYDSNPYMHGMANGMIYMKSLIDGRDPSFMDAPDVWLDDLPSPSCDGGCDVPTDGGDMPPCDIMQEPDPELFLDDEYAEEADIMDAPVERGRNLYHPPGMTLEQWEATASARQWIRNNAPDQSRGEARRSRNPFKKERRNPDPPGTVVKTIVETCGRNYHPEECREYEEGFRWAMSELKPFVVEAADPEQDREFRKEAERVFDMVKYALRNPGIQRQLISMGPSGKAIVLPMIALGEEEYNDVGIAFTPVSKSGKGSMATLEGHDLFNYGVQLDTLPEKFFDMDIHDALEALPYHIDKGTWMHEFIHVLDAKRYDDVAMAARRSEPENVGEYINSPQEFNAFYQERVHDVEEWLGKMRPAYLEETLATFDSFYDFALERFDAVVPLFHEHIDEKYLRKLKKRLYQFYVDYKEGLS